MMAEHRVMQIFSVEKANQKAKNRSNTLLMFSTLLLANRDDLP